MEVGSMMRSAWAILEEIRAFCEERIGENLVGIYIHGSLAFGCFDPSVSDIDFLIVVQENLSMAEKQALLHLMLELTPISPPKGLEMSVVLAQDCLPFVYPTPYLFHFSSAHIARALRDSEEYCRNFHGTDRDLAAHTTVTRAVGQVLCGKPIGEVFGEVPREAYLDSLRYDSENAVEDISENPVYVILNLCRIAAFLEEGAVLSKKEGGLWGLQHLPQAYREIIRAAMDAYTNGSTYHHRKTTEQAFAAEMVAKIFA
jgi:streptomycin 3"-adenylyltransferase